ncbi:hypothetical protein [Amycolatopsis sp. PS_44_ISF1]|uniref:hypothetical protein n=1 Tax=Amycolatopsis sp. PS_44_ISF1 TaxID=2974917 RepID=UPI0028DEB4DD|nr:hypothetical protein [Amycolatopsis sp. PS_44_ISF1]MDT8913310.1 hypothetical protein [Amycolatopsis sp. PS_44_ISF1]
MIRLRPGAFAAVAALTVLCTACAGSPTGGTPAAAPAASPSPAPAVLEASKVGPAVSQAAKQASSVHVSGSVSEGGNVKLDLKLGEDGASGTVDKDGVAVPVLRVKDKYYFRFTDSLVKEAGIPASSGVVEQLKDKWVSSTSQIGSGIGESFKDFLDYRTFVDNTVGALGSARFTGGERSTVGGASVLKYTSPEGTAFVAADEPHYLLLLQAAGKGTLNFSEWNKPVTVSEPPKDELYSGPGA